MTEDQILTDVWSQEADIRENTTDWLFSFLFMAYAPLDDADLEAYIAFSQTDAGETINRAMFDSFDELFTGINREPLIAQKFLPAVVEGDKRVILVDGQPVGAINRVPAKGETRSNMHVGGRPEKVGLTDRDREICDRIGPLLREKGQVFVGIDVIGDYLTEINVTSPTGIQELERFDGINIAAKIWEAIEAKR